MDTKQQAEITERIVKGQKKRMIILGAIVAGVVGFVLVAFVVAGAMDKSPREVYLVNGTKAAYDVMINGRRYHLNAGVGPSIGLPEGPVNITFPNKNYPDVNVAIHSALLTRKLKKHKYVLNPDGQAVLECEYIRYGTATPRYPDLLGPEVLHDVSDAETLFAEPPSFRASVQGGGGYKTHIVLKSDSLPFPDYKN